MLQSATNLISKTNLSLNNISALFVENQYCDKLLKCIINSTSSFSSSSHQKIRSTLKSLIKFTIIIPTITTVIGYHLCRFRLLPHKRLYQAWWLGTCVFGFVSTGAIITPLAILNKIGIISDRTLFLAASHSAQFLCKWLHWMNPQLRIFQHTDETLDLSKGGRSDSSKNAKVLTFKNDVKKGSIFIVNHTSMWDGFVMFAQPHFGFFKHVKFLGKAGVDDIPIVGFLVFRCLQYFKVHFAAKDNKSDGDYNNWSVDHEKQRREMDRVVQWINDGNTFAYAPEGRINRTPMTVQNPRHGMLKIFFNEKVVETIFTEKDQQKRESQLPDIFLLTMYPAHDFWPMKEAAGGLPCDLDVSLTKFTYPENIEEAWTQVKSCSATGTVMDDVEEEEEKKELNVVAVARDLQEFMQNQLNRVALARAKRVCTSV